MLTTVRRVSDRRLLDRYDHLADRPDRNSGKLHMCSNERNADNRDGKHDCGDEKRERRPSACKL